MPKRLIFASAIVAVLAAHTASPFVATWWMWHAAEVGDTAALASRIDWDDVRSGLKQDIADGIVGMPAQEVAATNSLTPFGSGFIAGIAGSAVDRDVTPQGLAIALRGLRLDPGATDRGRIQAAHFTSPTSFELALLAPGQDASDQPLRLELRWRAFGWQIVRAYVPQDLLEQADFDP